MTERLLYAIFKYAFNMGLKRNPNSRVSDADLLAELKQWVRVNLENREPEEKPKEV